MEVVVLNFIDCSRLAPRREDYLLEHIERLVAEMTAQVMHIRVPIFIHPIAPLFDRVKGFCNLHVAGWGVIAQVELSVLLFCVDLQVFWYWAPLVALTATTLHVNRHYQPVEQEDKREEHHFEEESNFHLELEHKHENYKLSWQGKFFYLIFLSELETDNQE